jgi:hypothetical protein
VSIKQNDQYDTINCLLNNYMNLTRSSVPKEDDARLGGVGNDRCDLGVLHACTMVLTMWMREGEFGQTTTRFERVKRARQR